MRSVVSLVGERVREARVRQSLTLEKLAELSGIPPESISRIERGRTTPSLRTLERLARGLGMDLANIVAADRPVRITDVRMSPELRGLVRLLEGRSERTHAVMMEIAEVLVRHEEGVS